MLRVCTLMKYAALYEGHVALQHHTDNLLKLNDHYYMLNQAITSYFALTLNISGTARKHVQNRQHTHTHTH